MSRSNYTDDCDHLVLYRQAVERSLCGKRGQSFLREMIAALDAMPVKRLLAHVLVNDGECCALGAVAQVRKLDCADVDDSDPASVGEALGVAASLAAEVAYMNDEHDYDETPEDRWIRMRAWVARQIVVEPHELAALGEAGK